MVSLDEFQVTLGMEFLLSAKVVPVPYLDTLFIASGEKSCIILIMYQTPKDIPKLLLAIQVKMENLGNEIISYPKKEQVEGYM